MSQPDPIEIAPADTTVVPRRVLPVSYSTPAYGGYAIRQRPPIVTAMGTIAVIVAVLSLLTSAICGVVALGMFVGSQMAAASRTLAASRAVVAQTTPPATIAGPAQIKAGPRGFNMQQRSVVMHVLESAQALSAGQQTQLEQLLARRGQDIMPFVSGNSPSPQLVRANLSDSGRIASYKGGERAAYYVIGTGKLEIYSDRAVFFPNTPGAPAIRIQNGIDPDDDLGGAASRANVNVAPTLPVSTYAIRPAATALTMIDAILSGGLAIYLLVVGILVLRQSPRSRGLQLAFAILKTPLAILCAFGWMWAISDSITSTSGGTITSPPGVAQTWFVIFLVIGLAYPLALLIALRMNRSAFTSV